MGTLNQLYEVYCGVASDLQATPAGARREQRQEQADELWLQYLEQGGGREPWHKPGQPWAYQDGFEELHPRAPKYEALDFGPQQLVFLARQLRVLLNLPKGYTYRPKPGNQDQFYEYTYYMDREVRAVKTFQRNHHLPVTGIVDSPTWQAMIADRGERKPAQLRNVFELPGSSDRPVPLVLRERRNWVLALDDIEERTYANHRNLALMAVLAYADISAREHVEKEMRSKWNEPRLREDVLVLDKPKEDEGKSWPVFVRQAPSTAKYRYGALSDDHTHSQGFVLGHPSHIVIALRGTEMGELTVDGLKAMVADLSSDLGAQEQLWMYDGSLDAQGNGDGKLGLQVHKGFYTAFDSIREQLAEHVREFRRDNPHKPIFVTGHSLGGAVACLAACYLRSHREFAQHPVQLYTFAQPRVGTLRFAEHYWTNRSAWARAPSFRYFRTAHLFDPITMVPSAYLADNAADVADLLVDFAEHAVVAREPMACSDVQPSSEYGNSETPDREKPTFRTPTRCARPRCALRCARLRCAAPVRAAPAPSHRLPHVAEKASSRRRRRRSTQIHILRVTTCPVLLFAWLGLARLDIGPTVGPWWGGADHCVLDPAPVLAAGTREGGGAAQGLVCGGFNRGLALALRHQADVPARFSHRLGASCLQHSRKPLPAGREGLV